MIETSEQFEPIRAEADKSGMGYDGEQTIILHGRTCRYGPDADPQTHLISSFPKLTLMSYTSGKAIAKPANRKMQLSKKIFR